MTVQVLQPRNVSILWWQCACGPLRRLYHSSSPHLTALSFSVHEHVNMHQTLQVTLCVPATHHACSFIQTLHYTLATTKNALRLVTIFRRKHQGRPGISQPRIWPEISQGMGQDEPGVSTRYKNNPTSQGWTMGYKNRVQETLLSFCHDLAFPMERP